MLEPILCGPPKWAPLIPKLRGHFAEFLNNASSAGLRILSSSTCVGLRYGYVLNNSSFSRHMAHILLYLFSIHYHVFDLWDGFAYPTSTPLVPVFPFPAYALHMRPYSSVSTQYRNINLLSIAYVLRPVLRSRLTQSRSALLWKPWIFSRKDSHLSLATHSGILSSNPSTALSSTASSVFRMLLYHSHCESTASVLRFSPGHFRRRNSRLVSCYALFECMAASEPTS